MPAKLGGLTCRSTSVPIPERRWSPPTRSSSPWPGDPRSAGAKPRSWTLSLGSASRRPARICRVCSRRWSSQCCSRDGLLTAPLEAGTGQADASPSPPGCAGSSGWAARRLRRYSLAAFAALKMYETVEQSPPIFGHGNLPQRMSPQLVREPLDNGDLWSSGPPSPRSHGPACRGGPWPEDAARCQTNRGTATTVPNLRLQDEVREELSLGTSAGRDGRRQVRAGRLEGAPQARQTHFTVDADTEPEQISRGLGHASCSICRSRAAPEIIAAAILVE